MLPRYTNLSTLSNGFPPISSLASSSSQLAVIHLVFLAFIVSPYCRVLASSFLTHSVSISMLSQISTRSSAYKSALTRSVPLTWVPRVFLPSGITKSTCKPLP
ncbi:hypothetical protein BpHYR1_017419 [Brachionus plicatilis]|uniref:Uncharacterized protein n=1 Tax=Brachionus plicatilis TaxID=10195 RepID=A0A3M7QIU3_BRAPC|nr:hypothetical protein BpHYR1_017419 [Brachionus plicatilis]